MKSATDLYSDLVCSKANPATLHQKVMLDATPDCIKIITTDGLLKSMNRAGCLALNVPLDSPFGMPWLSLLPPEVEAEGLIALRKAARGQSVSFVGKSLSPEGMVYWDNLLTPIVNLRGEVVSLLCVSRDVTHTTHLEQQLREALKREQLLAQEMRHRIKNVFSVVSGLIAMAQRESQAAGTDFTPTALQERLGALARASDAVFINETSADPDNSPVNIHTVITSVLEPYACRCEIGGNEAFVSPKEVTTLALFLHELATNSVKYGALSADRGRVAVGWTTEGNLIQLTWAERDGPKILRSPVSLGFGTNMVDRVIRSAQGQVERNWSPEGLNVALSFPRYSPLPLSA